MITRICLQCERPGFDLWVGKIPWRRERLSIPVFWPIQNIVHEVTESQTRLSGFPFQQTLFYWALKSLQVVTAAMKLKDTCFLEEKLWQTCSFCSLTQTCLTVWNPMDFSMLGFHVFHHLLEFIQTHVHWISDAIQPSRPLSSPSLVFNLS